MRCKFFLLLKGPQLLPFSLKLSTQRGLVVTFPRSYGVLAEKFGKVFNWWETSTATTKIRAVETVDPSRT